MNRAKKTSTVELQNGSMNRLLYRWKQRQQVHERLSKHPAYDSRVPIDTHLAMARTLGFCIRELEEALKKEE